MFCFPLKYPLITAEIETKKIEGDRIFKTSAPASICRILIAIKSEKTYSPRLHINPIQEKIAIETLKALLAPFISPTDKFSATIFEIAFGIPIDDIVRKIAYIW